MDWLRRNWPDLLIVIALIAVIGGIAMTLLTGGFSVPLFNSAPSTPSPSLSVPSTTTPASPSTATPAQPSTTDAGDGAESTDAGTPSDDDGAAATSASGDATDPGTTSSSSTSGGIAVLPPSDPATDDADDDEPTEATGSGDAATSAASSPASTPASGSAGSTAGAPPTSPSTQPGTEAPYRVSVGAFGNPANAERFAATFRAAGFPVFVGTQDDLSIVLVGPYDTLGEAEAAAERVAAGDFDVDRPVIFRLDDGPVAGQSDTADPEPEPAPAATESAAASPVEAVATASSGTFLQIGAYGDAAAAQPQIERAEALGFAVDVRTEDGLRKLVLGPFDDDGLDAARTRLERAGIEFFVRAD